jgi:tetratricopeptide (TPR) repeat protein
MKIIHVREINFDFHDGKYNRDYIGNIVVQEVAAPGVMPVHYIFSSDGSTFFMIDPELGTNLVEKISNLEYKNEQGAKALLEANQRESDLLGKERSNILRIVLEMETDKKIEQFATALKEKDALLNTAHDTLGALEKKLSEQRQYIKDLEKTLDAVKAPEPKANDSGPEARARALLILKEKFTAAEIAYMQQFGVPIF